MAVKAVLCELLSPANREINREFQILDNLIPVIIQYFRLFYANHDKQNRE